MLKSLVSKLANNPEKLGELVARLTSEHEASLGRLEAASDAWSNALADEAEGGGSEAATVAAEKELNAAQRAEASTKAALSAAQTRHKASLVEAQNTQLQDAWGKAETLSTARTLQAAKVAKSAGTFAADYLRLLEITGELFEALPVKPDLVAASLTQAQIEIAVRKEVLRCGVDWALSWPWGRVSLPAFMEPFEGANQVIRGWKANALVGMR